MPRLEAEPSASRSKDGRAPAAEHGLTEADRSTVVKVINTSEILKQHKPHY